MTGVDRFAVETLKALDQLISSKHPSVASYEFVILVPKGTQTDISFRHIPLEEIGSFQGHLWEQISLPLYRLGKQSLMLNLCNTAPVFSCSQLVVIHDAAVSRIPHTFSFKFRLLYKILMPVLGNFAKRVLTVSEFSKKDLAKFFHIPEHKVHVIGESGEHINAFAADTDILSKHGLGSRRYLLAVSSQAPHKNFKLISEAIEYLQDVGFDIVIAGGMNAAVFGQNAHGLSQKIKWTGYVSNEELHALYANALCFVFPSLYEGFGIPPLEAMSCGCPVLASNAASIPEVCGDAALYFSPDDPQALAALIESFCKDSDLQKRMIEKAAHHAATFSWKNAALSLVHHCDQMHS
ncbi:glycosyltransferase family 4 protein [Methylobacillus flagellatus]|uniref:glycosyltransferase family 4 protein n=1 Tax=Methylobacillus flagellatus TaxID=405 RepID=UPI0028539BA9|nr:glycosyltransferase family 1 protein [Methylobacillus flagellatus]MDR5172640.1 glycosyltransferase family 4 protein [Methylobacillus flagellatus]